MAGKELVGPVTFQRFGPYGSEVRIPYTPPRNTCDPRARACPRHRVACDCREAEHAEQVAEYRAEIRSWQAAVRTVLAGHRTFDWGAVGDHGWRGDGPLACQCTGCQIVRAADGSLIGIGTDADRTVPPCPVPNPVRKGQS